MYIPRHPLLHALRRYRFAPSPARVARPPPPLPRLPRRRCPLRHHILNFIIIYLVAQTSALLAQGVKRAFIGGTSSSSSKQRPSTSAPHPLTPMSQMQCPRYRRIKTIAALVAAAAAIGGRQRRGNGINKLHQSLALDFVHASR